MENVIIGFLATACAWLCFKWYRLHFEIKRLTNAVNQWARDCDVYEQIATKLRDEADQRRELHRVLLVEHLELKKQARSKTP